MKASVSNIGTLNKTQAVPLHINPRHFRQQAFFIRMGCQVNPRLTLKVSPPTWRNASLFGIHFRQRRHCLIVGCAIFFLSGFLNTNRIFTQFMKDAKHLVYPPLVLISRKKNFNFGGWWIEGTSFL